MALLDADDCELDTMSDGDEIMDRFKDEVKNINRGLGDVQFMDPDKDAEMIFNTILDSEKEIAHKEGREEGREEGIKHTQINNAIKMKKLNIDINTISEITNLSIDEIEKL